MAGHGVAARQRKLQWLKNILTACVQGSAAPKRILRCMEATSVTDISSAFMDSGLINLQERTTSEAVAELQLIIDAGVAEILVPAVVWASEVMFPKQSQPPSSKKAEQLAEAVYMAAGCAVHNLAHIIACHPSPYAETVFKQLMAHAGGPGMLHYYILLFISIAHHSRVRMHVGFATIASLPMAIMDICIEAAQAE